MTLREGMDVYGADGDKIGSIDAVYAEYISIEEASFEKTVHKTGEAVVDTEQVQRDEQLSGTVRREDVRVDDRTVSDADLRTRR